MKIRGYLVPYGFILSLTIIFMIILISGCDLFGGNMTGKIFITTNHNGTPTPLKGASVLITDKKSGISIKGTTDISGTFSYTDVAKGSQISVDLEGYKSFLSLLDDPTTKINLEPIKVEISVKEISTLIGSR